MEKKTEKVIEISIQIVLLIIATFAFSYLVDDVFGKVTVVSAQSEGFGLQDLFNTNSGPQICPETKNGEICQPMKTEDCDPLCNEDCIEGTFEGLPDDSECKLVTCYDEDEGTCEPRSTRDKCEDDGGRALDDPNGNSPECVKGCCTVADQAFFVTERQCVKRTESLGIELGVGAGFSSGGSELNCLASALVKTEGACVFSIANEQEDGCKFTTNEECSSIGGNFFEDTLCSNEDLDTSCERQSYNGCVESLDEVYWFDSCDNKENIYEGDSRSQKEDSWNDGLVKAKEDSCSLGNLNNPVRNQETCGNCNRLRGSICREETENPRQELDDDPDSGFVCIDMGCSDEQGERREHGESWCAYQSSIGLLGPDIPEMDLFRDLIPSNPITQLIGGARSTDTPGSRHFRKTCLDGKIGTSPCGNYRNEICVEQQTEKDGGGTFSQASCRINRWQECFAYNPNTNEGKLLGMLGEAGGKVLKAKLGLTCGLDPDCFVKNVNVDKGFEFSYCAPRYPPGFDVKNNPQAADTICSQASQECTVVYVKKISGWVCEANCDCEKPKFAQQMNELCTSLGDCGFSVNYVGSLPGGQGYSVREKKEGISAILADFLPSFGGFGQLVPNLLDAEPTPGEYIQPSGEFLEESRGNWINDIFAGTGIGDIINNFLGSLGGDKSEISSSIEGVDLLPVAGISGALGVGALAATYAGIIPYSGYAVVVTAPAGATIVGLEGGVSVASGVVGTSAEVGSFTEAGYAVTASPQYSAFGGALAGAGVGAAIVGFLIDVTGIAPGLGAVEAGVLVGGGAVSGAMIGSNVASASATAAEAAAVAEAAAAEAAVAAAAAEAGTGTAAVAVETAAAATEAVAAAEVAASGKGFAALCNNPIGCYIAIAILIVIILLKIIGVGDVEERPIQFECQPWIPPIGGDCESCGEDKLSDGSETFPCNNYACVSLGQNCEYVPGSEGPEGGECISVSKTDTSAPRIESLDEEVLSEGFRYSEFSDFGFKIRRSEGNECLSQFESLTFGFELDEHGRCSISGEKKETFGEMTPLADGLRKDHRHTFNFFDLESFGIDLKQGEKNDIALYLVCEDYFQTSNVDNPYIVNLCIDPEDFMPPLITYTGGSISIPFDADSKDITIFVNEPADVRWSFSDVGFDEIENEFICDFEHRGPQGFICTATIPIDSNVNEIFIRARDHPELEESERNENQESVRIIITRSENALLIDSISPNNEIIIAGTPVASINVEVKTSGGLNGEATCYYSIDGRGEDVFSQTDSTTHSQLLSQVTEGSHVLDVRCIDEALNTAEEEATFTVQIEDTIPNVGRVYADSNILYVVTNEPAECSYKNTGCNFAVSEGEPMNRASNGITHHTTFDPDKTYYIKCKDEYGNEKTGQCDIVVSGGLF